ncbi:MAG: type I-E CRISPR-associated protein Cas6/Cse3/CasE, partial [Armatimonadetes bacterium]|nr:type I-E CRISPR-associated protein Cas6/Cse3/CasE [Armatimonadota bacterium]
MTLYLSRLVLDALDRQTLQTLASPNHLHQAVLDGFERGARGDRRVLYRLEPELERRTRGRVLLVQSEVEPDWSRRWQPWFGVPPLTAVRAMDPERWELQAGSVLRFRLRANPTRRERGEGDRRPDGG